MGETTTATDNMVPPLEPYNLFTTDPVLADAIEREGGGRGDDRDLLVAFGARVGGEEVVEWGHLANRHPPELVTHDPNGGRIDEVRFHPAYHSLMDLSVSAGIHCMRYEREPGDGGYVTRNALMYLMSQIEVGHGCPTSMTGAVLPALRHQPELAEIWEPRLISRSYDPRLIDPAEKTGCLMGMGLTEKQGGSDVRANSSTAVPVNGGGPGGEHRLTGHKWFTSAPMCDAFLTLAHAPKGLSCFLVPRILPDGTRNPLHFQRLKDKLGNRSNASGELEYENAAGWMVGEEGRGVPTIIEMVNGTRIDCTNWSAAMMRQAVARAGWYVAHRTAFGATLIDKPLMQNVLADLEIETEAATLLTARISGAYDRASVDPDEAAFARLGTAVAKYWLTKRATPVVREALECVGGNAYVEESILPRLYREVPLNAIWEGAGNVIALDVLRAMARSPQSTEAFLAEVELGQGADRTLDAAMADLRSTVTEVDDAEANARRLVEQMAVCWAASLLVRHGDESVSAAYLRSRLGGDWGSELGTLPTDADLDTIARRAVPAV
ncbi:MAG: DNA alkylation response protein [Actinomycetia bacterium]|nr:DNA alkylation response protein [Actinomycetes bacterium]